MEKWFKPALWDFRTFKLKAVSRRLLLGVKTLLAQHGFKWLKALPVLACISLLTSCGWFFSSPTIQEHAYLQDKRNPSSEPLKLDSLALSETKSICLPKYNYWCLKTPGSQRWRGQVGEDFAKHAIFSDPKYSARAFTRVMRTYHRKHGIRTARQLINRYAPQEDCIGSQAYCPKDPAFHFGIQGLPYGRIGSQWIQYSRNRPAGYSKGGSCFVQLMHCPRGFNPTSSYAEHIAKAVGKHVDDDLGLFDDKSTLNLDVAVPLFQAIGRWELGACYVISPELIVEGARLEHQDYFKHG